MAEADAPEAPMNDDAAVEAILSLDGPAPNEAAIPKTVPGVDDAPADALAPVEELADGEAPDEDSGDEEVDLEAVPAASAPISAPEWWDAEAKAAFLAIPSTPAAREYAQRVQQFVAEAEAKREAVTQRVKAEAAAVQKSHGEQLKVMNSALERLNGAVPGEVEQFERDYGDIVWSKMPEWAEKNPAEAAKFFATYNARKESVGRLIHAKAEAQKVASDAFVVEQTARLRQIAPELAGSSSDLKALGDYAVKTGFAEAIKQASGDELVILNKARLWDEAQAKAAASAKNQRPGNPNPPPRSVKPVAAQATGTHAQRTYAQAKEKAMKTGDDDAAVAAILAGGF